MNNADRYEIRLNPFTENLVHYVVVKRGQHISEGYAHTSMEIAAEHLLTLIPQHELQILEQAADVKQLLNTIKPHPDYKTVDGQARYNTLSGQYQAYVHCFSLLAKPGTAYVIHALVDAIITGRKSA